jgi:hypothetical protein
MNVLSVMDTRGWVLETLGGVVDTDVHVLDIVR